MHAAGAGIVLMCRKQVYNLLTGAVRSSANVVPVGSASFTLEGYVTISMEVVVCVVSSAFEADEGLLQRDVMVRNP